jgi:hypothetical protein
MRYQYFQKQNHSLSKKIFICSLNLLHLLDFKQFKNKRRFIDRLTMVGSVTENNNITTYKNNARHTI